MTPAELMLAIFLREAPSIAQKPDSLRKWQDRIAETDRVIVQVTIPGALVSPEVDAAILRAVSWYEGRFNPRPADGDCHWNAGTIARPMPSTWVCDAVGTLQVAKSNLSLIAPWPESQALDLPKKITVDMARTPETSVKIGYATLTHWKHACKGPPGRWLTAYGWGHCPGNYVDMEGKRRCALATAMLGALDQKPDDWVCGHEKKALAKREAALAAFVGKQEKQAVKKD